MIEASDLHWIAGLIEGEGCFTLAKPHGRYVSPQLRVQMTDEDVVNRVSSILKAPAGVSSRQPSTGKRVYYTSVYKFTRNSQLVVA